MTETKTSIGKNLDYIKKHPVKVVIEGRHLPGGAEHNLMCWRCGKNHAVYSMYPEWVFKMCWKCQAKYGLIKPKKWWEFWK